MFEAKLPVSRPLRIHRRPAKPRQPRLLMAPPGPDPRLPAPLVDPNARFLAE